MNTRKPLVIAGIIAAMSLGSVGIAEASTHTIHFASSTKSKNDHVDPITTVLATLVKAGTITQAQSDAISAAIMAALPAKPSIGGGAGGPGNDNVDGPGMGKEVKIKGDLNVITTTLGITVAQLQTDFAAGQSLATIAGAKNGALINALVAAETTKINAKVTAGEITQVQGTALIAGLTAAVTAAVNAAPGKGHHGHHGSGGGASTPSASPSPSATN